MIAAYAVELDFTITRGDTPCDAVDLELTLARNSEIATPVELSYTQRVTPQKVGYIAGTADGIVTINGVPASRQILYMDVNDTSYRWSGWTWSKPNGHYLIDNLDPAKQYLVMCRDHERQYEPVCWDYVTPATDLTIAEQQALWDSWNS